MLLVSTKLFFSDQPLSQGPSTEDAAVQAPSLSRRVVNIILVSFLMNSLGTLGLESLTALIGWDYYGLDGASNGLLFGTMAIATIVGNVCVGPMQKWCGLRRLYQAQGQVSASTGIGCSTGWRDGPLQSFARGRAVRRGGGRKGSRRVARGDLPSFLERNLVAS